MQGKACVESNKCKKQTEIKANVLIQNDKKENKLYFNKNVGVIICNGKFINIHIICVLVCCRCSKF